MLFVGVVSCTKQGPAGPKGPAGDTGQAGPAGNAKVIISAWTGGFSGAFAQWQVPAITSGVLDSSAILVYWRPGVGMDMVQLPFASNSGFVVTDDINVGVIDLYCSPGGSLSQDSFRYVIIPQGVAGTGVPRGYEEMTTRLGIAP